MTNTNPADPSRAAEVAYHEFNAHLDSLGARLHADEESFIAGYSAAAAQSSALLTLAVDMTIEAAADVVDVGLDIVSERVRQSIRALNVSALVERVLAEQSHAHSLERSEA